MLLNAILSNLNAGAAIAVVLGLCLLFHEAGHFALAKLCGMRVEEFAFGFGRALLRGRRGETEYRLNLFPVGGYVRIAGMEPGAEAAPGGFHTRPRWQGALVVLAGSFANVLLATLLFTAVTLWQGVPDPNDQGIYVGKVSQGSPAQSAGLRAGDRIVAVDGQDTSLELTAVQPGPGRQAGLKAETVIERLGDREVNTPAEMLAALQAAPPAGLEATILDLKATSLSEQEKVLNLPVPAELRRPRTEPPAQLLAQAYGVQFAPLGQSALVGYIAARPRQAVGITVNRHGQTVTTEAFTTVSHGRAPARDKNGTFYSEMREIGRIGVVLRGATKAVGPGKAVQLGLERTVGSVAMVVMSIQLMARHEVRATELAGPVAIMAISAERAQIGWDAVLGWGGLISANLAFVNLLPIPIFDGFKVVLLAFEAIIRRRINARLELVLSVVGLICVIFLFVALTAKDVTNLVRYGTP